MPERGPVPSLDVHLPGQSLVLFLLRIVEQRWKGPALAFGYATAWDGGSAGLQESSSPSLISLLRSGAAPDLLAWIWSFGSLLRALESALPQTGQRRRDVGRDSTCLLLFFGEG